VTPLVLAALLAAADAPFFQMGSRLGLVPPPGLAARLECLCFMSVDGRATIMVTDAPRDAFAQAESPEGVAALKRQGMATPKREEIVVDGRRAILISGAVKAPENAHLWFLAVDVDPQTILVSATIQNDALGKFRASDMRHALLNARLRAREVALAEQVDVLRFTVADHAGFRLAGVVPGTAVMFTEGPADEVKAAEQPVVWVMLGFRRADTAEERASLARDLAAGEPALTAPREVVAEGYSRDGADWHHLERTGAHPETGEPIRAVQVVRFHAGNSVWVRATLREDDRERLTPRVLQLAHSVATR
jgi:hypothetical protein